MVSNNQYRLGRAVGSGTRPSIDDGLLGIAIAGAPTGRGERGHAAQRPVRQWSAPTFEVRSDQPIPAGIDGEALTLEPPLRFSIRSLVLRVRIAPQHPGASPSARLPEGIVESVRDLGRVAAGRNQSTQTQGKTSNRPKPTQKSALWVALTESSEVPVSARSNKNLRGGFLPLARFARRSRSDLGR